MKIKVTDFCLVSDNSPKTPAYVLHYLSFTPPSSGHKLYVVFHNKSSCQVPRNLKSLGSFRGLGAFFLVFLRQSIGNENLFIFVGEFP